MAKSKAITILLVIVERFSQAFKLMTARKDE
jgi:hypothetical protein